MEMFELDHYYVLISFITYTLSSIPVVWQQSIGERERERGGGKYLLELNVKMRKKYLIHASQCTT